MQTFEQYRDAINMANKTKDLIKDLAIIYMRYKDSYSKLNHSTINELHGYVNKEFEKIKNEVVFAACEIDCNKLEELHLKTNEIWVSTLHNNSKLFPGNVNLKWRAIHDSWHLTGLDCDFWGEYETYLKQSQGMSYEAKQVMFSEIVLQAAFCLHFGYFSERQKVVLIDIVEFSAS